VDETGVAVAGRAADALAEIFLRLVDADAQWGVARVESARREMVGDFLDARLMAHRRKRKLAAARRLRRIDPALAVDLVKLLRLGVVRLEVAILQRPLRRNAADVLHLLEVAFAQSEQRRAVKLGVPTDVITHARAHFAAVLVVPDLRPEIARRVEGNLGIPILLLARQERPALEHQDAPAARRKLVQECAAA